MNGAVITMEYVENRDLNTVGSSRIRGRWLAKYWPELSEYHIGKQYDFLIFQKAYWDTMLEQYQGIKIFDICDPDWIDGRPVMETIGYCDAVVTASEALRDYIKKFTDKPVVCIPDRKDLEQFVPRGEHIGRAKKAVWFGYSSNFQYLNKALDLIIEKNLELTVISNEDFILPQIYYGRLNLTNIKYNYSTVYNEIKKHDLAILPSPNDYRGGFKTDNKTTDCWALGVPVVQVPEDLDKFMSAEGRNKERTEKLKMVREQYDVKKSVTEYKELLKGLENGIFNK